MTKEQKKAMKKQYEVFKKWLIRNDMSMTQFAKRCGVSKQFIHYAFTSYSDITPRFASTLRSGGYTLYQKYRRNVNYSKYEKKHSY